MSHKEVFGNRLYDKEKDQYTCPEGYTLRNRGFMKKERHFIYRTKASHCKNCGFRKECTDSAQGRTVIRHIHEASLEKAKEHLKTTESKATIAERSKIIECVFGSEKKDLGLKRAKFREIGRAHV